jgi:hypothetical protein
MAAFGAASQPGPDLGFKGVATGEVLIGAAVPPSSGARRQHSTAEAEER